MAKLEDEISTLKNEIQALKKEHSQISFQILRLISEIGKIQPGVVSEDGGSSGGGGTSTVDLGPIQERLDELSSKLVTKDTIDEINARLDTLASERMKEAQETIARLTTLFQNGLEMVKLESSLSDIKSLLEETVLKD